MTTESRIQQSKHVISTHSRTYHEIVTFLNKQKPIAYDQTVLDRMKQLDTLLGSPSSKSDTILVGGTNGKSLTIHAAARLLREERYRVGIAYSSHMLNYNERMMIDTQAILNKDFTTILNEVMDAALQHNITATSFELMTIASLLYFHKQQVDVILLEVGKGGMYDATSICNPKIAAITRIAKDHEQLDHTDLDEISFEMLETAKPGTIVISAEQSKLRLKKMKKWCETHNVSWAMPIRRPAMLPYVYEQLFGRTVSLGERIAQIYIQNIKKKFSPFLKGNLIASKEGQRGRPTMAAKQQADLHPMKSLKKFWLSEFTLLPGRFQLIEKETPNILLDNADNLDALENTFLGIRLLGYQKSIKHLTIIMGVHENIHSDNILRLLRYLFKKEAGTVFFVPLEPRKIAYHDPQKLVEQAKGLGINNAKPFMSFSHALEESIAQSKEENLVVVTGSQTLLTQYWQYRGIKRF